MLAIQSLFSLHDRPHRFARRFTSGKSSELSIPQNSSLSQTSKTRMSKNKFFTHTYIIIGSVRHAAPVSPLVKFITTARFLRNLSIAIAGLRDRARVPRWNLTGMSTFYSFDFTMERESTCVVATGQTGQLLSQHIVRAKSSSSVETRGQEQSRADCEMSRNETRAALLQ